MTPERWRQIEELYDSVRERALADRAALLAEADPGLRREVEAMLVLHRAVPFIGQGKQRTIVAGVPEAQ